MIRLRDHYGNYSEPKTFTFPGGEVQVQLPKGFCEKVVESQKATIDASVRNSEDIMVILLVNNAIKNLSPGAEVTLNIPYLPYARQDRVCSSGEAFSSQVAAQIINSCNFKKVVVSDPHSDVSTAMLNNVYVIGQDLLFSQVCRKGVLGYYSQKAEIVSPDSGAEKKAMKIAKMLGKETLIKAGKIRDVSTGEITSTVVYDKAPKIALIVDDICDGGRTFIELAKKLREAGTEQIGLYVTHGIFSKGKGCLEEWIDDVFAYFDWEEDGKIS